MKKLQLLLFAIVLTIGVNTAIKAQSEKPLREADPSMEMTAIKLATENARMGYELQEPLLLMSAAKILLEVPVSELKVIKLDEKPIKDGVEKESGFSELNTTTLLKDALLFAQGNNLLVQSIEEMAKTAGTSTRGAIGGPYTLLKRVNNNSTNTYSVNFLAGELAEVAIIGDGDTDLDLLVFDQSGNLISADSDYTDRCYVSWIPKWTGEYTIVVKNLGSTFNEFILITN